MLPASGSVLVWAALVVQVILLMVLARLLGFVRLLCDRERREYVMSLTLLMLDTAGALMHGTSPRCTARRSQSATASASPVPEHRP
jgi:hypothetical protein